MGKEGATVQMVEHGLAALAGLQIDNCELVVFGSELPGGDGSSQPAVEALLSAGIEVQDAERKCLRLERVIRVGDDQAWIEARPSTTVGCRIRYELDYGEGPIGKQSVEVKLTPESFCQELAAARTFLLAHEVDMMRRQGVGANTTYQDLLVFAENGPIGNRLRFSNECARHKALDVVGDLAIIGCDLNADIVAYRSGHVLNAQLARALHACYCEGPSAEISAQQG